MQLHLVVLFLVYQLAIGKPTFDNVEHDDFHDRRTRYAARHGLADLERRVTTMPDLVPTITVNLGTDSTGTTQMVSPLRDGGTIGTVKTTTLPQSVAGADPTGQAGGRDHGKGQAQSSPSKGGASNPRTVPIYGVMMLGLLGL